MCWAWESPVQLDGPQVGASSGGSTNLLPEFSFSRTVPKELLSVDRWLRKAL